jgi:hypothetical protein
VEAHKSSILLLLTEIGVPGRCRDCGGAIFWVRHRTGDVCRYTPYGQNHSRDCEKLESHDLEARIDENDVTGDSAS